MTRTIEIVYNDGRIEKIENATDEQVRHFYMKAQAKNSDISTIQTKYNA